VFACVACLSRSSAWRKPSPPETNLMTTSHD
jgi:hypothetical protein